MEILNELLGKRSEWQNNKSFSYHYQFNSHQKNEDSLQLYITKLNTNDSFIALELNNAQSLLQFYCLCNNSWKPINGIKTNYLVHKIEFIDLNGDNKKEIITYINRKGNFFQQIYTYTEKPKMINPAGILLGDTAEANLKSGYRLLQNKR